MRTHKLFAPANNDGVAANDTPSPKKVNKKSKLPTKDNDFGNLCTKVNDKWKTLPTLTLLYITQAQFETKAALFNTTLAARQKAGGDRSPLTTQLKNTDATIDKAISGIKGYLKEKYEGDAEGYYALFGIQKIGKNYELPTDREKRKDMLDMIIAATASEGFGSKKYGTAFWTQMKTDYTAQWKKANTTDGSVSTGVGNKNQLREELTEVLDSIINLVKANYPKTWEGE
ncbi:MAG: hypothetical protein NTZ59_00890, partial [Bacteroidetes bacterium]|nr:hypothetical protein [Bacteroidota bacterium]